MNEPKKTYTITESQLRSGITGLLVVVCFALIVGYYWGKRRAYEEFFEVCRSDSLRDQVSVALCSLYNTPTEEGVESSEGAQAGSESEEESSSELGEASEKLYFAELAGFGTLRHAKQYAHKLGKRSIEVRILERVSKSPRGKTRTWYQVVVKPMKYDELQSLVDTIKSEDRLQGVTLVEYTQKHQPMFERTV